MLSKSETPGYIYFCLNSLRTFVFAFKLRLLVWRKPETVNLR